jgi:hypothetical protein
MMWGGTKAEAPHGPQPGEPEYAAGVVRFNSRRPSRFAFTSGADEDVPSARIFSDWVLKYLKNPESPSFLGSELANWVKLRVAGDARVGATGQVPQYFQIPRVGYGGGDFAFFVQTAPRR